MRLFFRNGLLQIVLALLAGLGIGLAYSWLISPVEYVDANPSLLRADFKDQYRIVIAASYASTHDLARARARLELLSDSDPVGDLSAQAQRMLAAGESQEHVNLLVQLAKDLQQGMVSAPATITPFTPVVNTPALQTPIVAEPTQTLAPETMPQPTLSFEQTPLPTQPLLLPTPRPTSTPITAPDDPFTLVGQDTICDPGLQPGLLQIILMDSRRRQIPGIEIIVSWDKGESRFFTGFKPEIGNGYADFVMQADVIYSVRVVEGGSFIPDISVPSCADPNGVDYAGGYLLTFQQP
ncbi:MAG: hypothetical protein HYZ23_07725 [Chloroflexi bacterium]|nr:hypothetical protein [Chloroflexota bacterium]